MLPELKVVNPESNDFGIQIGITKERQHELAVMLDGMVWDFSRCGSVIRAFEIYNEILSFVDNYEEYTYCVVNHCAFLMRHGISLVY